MVDAVHSVLAQEEVEVEVVVVDDASSDGSADVVADTFAGDLRVTVLHQPDNLGPSAARNRGTTAAAAELVTFLDSDDVLVAGGLARQLEALRAPGGPDAVVGSGRLVHVEGPSPAWARRLHEQGLTEPIWVSVLTDRRHLDAVGGFDEAMRMAEDIDLFVRLRESGARVEVLPDVVVERRRYGDNLTRDLEPGGDDLRMVLRRATARRRGQRSVEAPGS
ncbi:hypothetical protein B7486_59840 [cyanobacterium TDX16]|nr:hypothetical protein B7486_59840 [cyanobacterium TDX16]